MQTYFDNAATSFPKPLEVIDAMTQFQMTCGASPGRGVYEDATRASALLDECRCLLAELVNAPSTDHCILTSNCTDSLNLAICGIARHWLRRGCKVHVVTTAMDHNSVFRPLEALAREGATHTVVQADPQTGLVNPQDIQRAITPDTKLVAVAHGSNVTGSVQDLGVIRDVIEDIPFLVDAAQTMGHTPIDVQRDGIDLLAFPGHKGLLGPLGTGGLIIKPSIESVMEPIRFGGTGSVSESPKQPTSLPDKYECGSHNTIGIAGLVAGLKWIAEKGVETLHAHELSLCSQFIEGCGNIEGVEIIGPQSQEHRCGVFSLRLNECPHEIAVLLERENNIKTRAGLHCAPYAHQTMGTTTCGGTVRISIGPFHSSEDIQFLLESIQQVAVQCTQGVLV